MINENIVKGKWLEIKGELQKSWGKLTNDELDKTKGDVKAIGGLIQQRYGEAEEKSIKKISDIFARFDTQKDKVSASTKAHLKN